jgi:uncharacterized protein (DUF983 family)
MTKLPPNYYRAVHDTIAPCCPYRDCGRFYNGDDTADEYEITCEKCGKRYAVHKKVEVTYDTTTLED